MKVWKENGGWEGESEVWEDRLDRGQRAEATLPGMDGGRHLSQEYQGSTFG
jgi:hypothetical protein